MQANGDGIDAAAVIGHKGEAQLVKSAVFEAKISRRARVSEPSHPLRAQP
jgi:hypothetical protein